MLVQVTDNHMKPWCSQILKKEAPTHFISLLLTSTDILTLNVIQKYWLDLTIIYRFSTLRYIGEKA